MTEIAHISSFMLQVTTELQVWSGNRLSKLYSLCKCTSDSARISSFALYHSVKQKEEKILECQQYCRGITHTGCACSVCHTNDLYFKNHKFLTITFLFTIPMCLRNFPILEFKNLKYRRWSNFLENHAGSLQQSTETNFTWPLHQRRRRCTNPLLLDPLVGFLFVWGFF